LELDIATGTVLGSPGFWELWGLSQRESVHISVLEQLVIPEDAAIRSTPQSRARGDAIPTVEYRIRRHDSGELRWLYRSIDFVRDAVGKPVKMFGVMQDITDRKEAESRQQLLVHELEHRIKNILAMVTAIVSQTLRDTDIDSARTALTARLRALANAHDLLNKTRWTNASIEEVVQATIAPFSVRQISVRGPRLPLDPKRALSLALAVNELATNALKYGALSTSTGMVSIEWSATLQGDASKDRILTWRWKETGGPPVDQPLRRGFGSLLLKRVLAIDFNGAVELDYCPDGVQCVLTAPSTMSTARAER
jgi:PAS domain S-box-containing protein